MKNCLSIFCKLKALELLKLVCFEVGYRESFQFDHLVVGIVAIMMGSF